MAKLAPKMNMFFSIGMNLNTLVGIIVLAMSFPWIFRVHAALMDGSFDRFIDMLRLVR